MEKAKIYQIKCYTTGNIYIGSTCEKFLYVRLGKHVSNYKAWLNNEKKYISSYEVIKNNNYKIELLLEVENCFSKTELYCIETEYIKNNDCVNKKLSYRSDEEKKEYFTEYMKEYREKNRETILEKEKEYREKNRETILERARKYYKENKGKILGTKTEYNKEYREKNKERLKECDKKKYLKNKDIISKKGKEKYTCECGSTLRKDDKKRHEKTNKHQFFLEK